MKVRNALFVAALLAALSCSAVYAESAKPDWVVDKETQAEAQKMNHEYDVSHGYAPPDKNEAVVSAAEEPVKPEKTLADPPKVIKPPKADEEEEYKPKWKVEWEKNQAIQNEGLEHNTEVDDKTPHRRFQRVR